jgi:hypothetical protein
VTQAKDSIERILGPRTFASAMQAIQTWDRQARSMPLLSEQIAWMPDGPKSWSTTHNWPSVLNAMRSAGLLVELPSQSYNGWKVPMTEITELGREVREYFAKTGL